MFFSFFLFLVKTYVHQLTTSEAYSEKIGPLKRERSSGEVLTRKGTNPQSWRSIWSFNTWWSLVALWVNKAIS